MKTYLQRHLGRDSKRWRDLALTPQRVVEAVISGVREQAEQGH